MLLLYGQRLFSIFELFSGIRKKEELYWFDAYRIPVNKPPSGWPRAKMEVAPLIAMAMSIMM